LKYQPTHWPAWQATFANWSFIIQRRLAGAGNGVVVYGVQNKTYTWSAATGQLANQLIDTTPGQVLISGSTMYFTQGSSQAVYKVMLQ
jgi:hypothetical protein